LHHHHVLLAAASAPVAVVVAVWIVHNIPSIRLQPGSGKLEALVVGREDAVLLHDHWCGLLNHSFPCNHTYSTADTTTDASTNTT